jgi:putative membrane protein
MMSPRRRVWLWGFAAVLAPLLTIGILLGAMSNADTATERIPIALVNNDELITETDENGEETFFLASRPLVLELVGSDDLTLDWVITDSETAAEKLETGEVYAVLEIPDNFSEAVRTLETDEPEAASFVIRTNPARSYLAGVVAEQIGAQVATALSDEFGKEILSGLFTVIVDLGDAFSEAADASREIADGVDELSDGVSDLRNGTGDLVSGYAEFDSGLGEYLDGVGSLSEGLSTFERETRDLSQLSEGVAAYTGGVGQFAAGLRAQIAELDAAIPVLDQTVAALQLSDPENQLQTVTSQLVQAQVTRGVLSGIVDNPDFGTLVSSGPTLASSVDDAVDGIRDGLEESADGGQQLADAGGELRSGSAEVLSGVRELNSGVGELDDGVGELADGVREFADGLTEGAEQIAEESPGDVADSTVDTLISPVVSSAEVGETNAGATDSLTALIVPLGMWLAGLMTVVLLPFPSVRVLSSTVSSTTLVARQLGSTLVVALAQGAIALTLLHTLGGVNLGALGWSTPLVFAGSFAFTAVQYAVWAGSPLALIPVSLLILVAQIATFGVVLPGEILPSLYQAVVGWGPISWLADALLGAAAGEGGGRVAGPLIGLILLGVASTLVARALFGRRRHKLVREYYLTGVAR